MLQTNNGLRNTFWRKTLTVVLLPVIIFLWMTGWILTQIGSERVATETTQKSYLTHPEFQVHGETKMSEDDEDYRAAHNPEIIA